MINEEKIKLMTKLAVYESGEGKEKMKIGSYRKKDYVSFRMIVSWLWVSVGYFILLGLYLFFQAEVFLESLYNMNFLLLGVFVLVGYLVVIIIYLLVAHSIYTKRYKEARNSMKPYYLNLKKLNKIYEEEKQKTNTSTLGGEL